MPTMIMRTSIFGTLYIEEGVDLWEDCLIELDGHDLDVILSIEGGLVYEDNREQLMKLLESMPEMYRRAKDAICAASPADRTVAGFVDFHLEELSPDALMKALHVESPGDATVEAFFDALHPRTIEITQDEDGGTGCWLDFSIGRDYSDEVLCVRFNGDMEIYEMAHES